MAITAYKLSPKTKAQILKHFPPKYPSVLAHHITVAFGVPFDTPLPPLTKNIEIIGYADDGKGIEALVVSINGGSKFNGKPFHLALSCDPTKMAPASFDTNPNWKKRERPYKPASSIGLIETKGYTEASAPFKIAAKPVIYSDQVAAKPAKVKDAPGLQALS